MITKNLALILLIAPKQEEPLLNENSSAFDNPQYDNNRTRPQNNNHQDYQQLYDKYLNLAREAFLGGDQVTSESHYQYADHYLRLLNEGNIIGLKIIQRNIIKVLLLKILFTPDTRRKPQQS